MKKHLDYIETCHEFKPKLNSHPPVFELKEPLVLKGFSRYIEQMDKARQIKSDKEERENKVFISGKNWSRDNLVTIPQPFKLSYVSPINFNY